jgi:hypothetical protein
MRSVTFTWAGYLAPVWLGDDFITGGSPRISLCCLVSACVTRDSPCENLLLSHLCRSLCAKCCLLFDFNQNWNVSTNYI